MLLMVLNPAVFGFADAGQAVQFSFFTVAFWWAVFTIPIFLYVEEKSSERTSNKGLFKAALSELLETVVLLRGKRTILLFLVAYWFYIDGVGTIFRMAVDYGLSIGLESNDLIVALLMVQFVGFPAALVFGWLGQQYGPKLGIYCGIVVYITATIWGYFITSGAEFFILAFMVGLVQGGIQALSRSLYAQMIPQDQVGQYFGIFNMIGKAAAILGPVLVGWAAVAVGHRTSILTIIGLFVVGGLLLMKVKTPTAESELFESRIVR